MVKDQQVRRLKMLVKKEKTKAIAASKAGMDEKTARKYLKNNQLPSQTKIERTWKTRKNPFELEWENIREMLLLNPGLEGRTIFEYLQRKNPGEFMDCQLRTLQRHIKIWRAIEGPGKEVFFPQVHYPGDLCESDFTDMSKLNITIQGEQFSHLLYHFVLTYSNWETGTICFSESYESLSEGFQNAIWELGGIPVRHRTDRLSAAVHKECNPEEFTARYSSLLSHYKIKGEKIRVRKPNENGDVEQSHNRFKKALNQALLLRNSRNFETRDEYKIFINKLFDQLNSGRKKLFQEEILKLKRLPERRLNDCKRVKKKIGPSSTIHISHNTYSVHSRLIKENIEARLYAERIEIWYSQKKVDEFPRLRGEGKHKIEYRHIIDWLVRKPGAFENYRYKEDLYPSSHFRITYDSLCVNHSSKVASKEYLKILHLAHLNGEEKVENILKTIIYEGVNVTSSLVKEYLENNQNQPEIKDVQVDDVQLSDYDELIKTTGVA